MELKRVADVHAQPAKPPACSGCGRPRDEKLRCWKCHDRPCRDCGRLTGSAFIQLCLQCERLQAVWDAVFAEAEAERE
jgi:hypothetical protein